MKILFNSLLFLLALTVIAIPAHSQDAILNYSPPPNFFKISGVGSPEVFSSSQVNATVGIYQFRSFNGNIQEQWQRTMLREWIDPMYRETSIGSQPTGHSNRLQDGTLVLTARFNEGAGLAKAHLRAVYVVERSAAIVDITAASDSALAQILPSIGSLFQSMSISTASSNPRELQRGAGGDSGLEGLYQGIKSYYNTNLFGSTASGYYTPRPHYYLFSRDGHFYRTFDIVMIQRVDPTRFNFALAAARDPENSGIFRVQGNRLVLQFARGGQMETGMIVSSNSITISDISYSRQ